MEFSKTCENNVIPSERGLSEGNFNPSDFVDAMISLTSEIPVPGLKSALGFVNSIIKMFLPNDLAQIKRELNELQEKMDNMYNIVTEAARKNEIETRYEENNAQLSQLIIKIKKDDLASSLNIITSMTNNLLVAAQKTGDVLKDYEKTHKNDSGDLRQYIGNYAYNITLLYKIYGILQYAINMVAKHFSVQADSDLSDQQQIAFRWVTDFFNCLIPGKESIFFDFKYPSWCEGVFLQKAVRILSVDGGVPMKYSLECIPSPEVKLSGSYLGGHKIEEFIIHFSDRGYWELWTQDKSRNFNNKAGMYPHNSMGSFGPSAYLYSSVDSASYPSMFKISYKKNKIKIWVSLLNFTALTANKHGERVVKNNGKDYEWTIKS